MSADMGGPAFPDPSAAHPGAHPPLCHKGMTLWDYYAAASLQGYLAGVRSLDVFLDSDKVAFRAAKFADAMLAEREKRVES